MAEMDTSSGGGHHKKGPGVKKSKKLSTRVDLTPMVDLGFLLITFFIFTTTMSEATAMKIYLPADSKDTSKVKESGALTLLLTDKLVFHYEGQLTPNASNLKITNYIAIREMIINK